MSQMVQPCFKQKVIGLTGFLFKMKVMNLITVTLFLPSQPSRPLSTPQPFQDEDDEADCDSDSSGCLADGELDVNKEKYQELVQLNFATLTKFLESQLSQISATSSTGGPVKKRRYNNRGRAAKAAATRQLKESQHGLQTKRIPRNNIDTCLV